MALKIVWTKRAEEGFNQIINYLEENWTDREIRNFVQETYHFLGLLKSNPYLLEPSTTLKNTYRGPLNRLTIVTYRIKLRKEIIELLNIRSAKQKPLI